MIAFTITRQVLFSGLVDGLSIGLLALGIVLIYRSSQVINFAVGAMGVLAASLLALLVVQFNWNFWPALLVAVASGAAFAAAVEATIITRLFRAPRVILLVATIGIAQLAQLLQVALPEVDDVGAAYPTPISSTWTVAGIRIRGPELLVLITVPLLALALSLFLSRTNTGKAIRAAAANPERARLSAINPKTLSTLVWTIAGVLSSVSLVLLAGTSGRVASVANLGPNTLVRVLAAALIGGMVSFPLALVGGIGIGVGQALFRYNYPTQTGAVDALLFLVVLIAVVFLSRRAAGSDDASFSFAPRVKPVPERLRNVWWVRQLPRLVGLVAVIAAIALPFIITEPSRHFLYSRVLILAIVAVSLVVLTGWAGQVSLGQMAFAGIGALGTSALVLGNDLGLGIGGLSVDVEVPKFTFPSAVIIMTLACSLIAVVIGVGALRVRGLFLAVVTVAFALATVSWVFPQRFLSGDTSTVFLERPKIGSLDLTEQRTYYFLSLAVLVLVVVWLARLRRSGIGRSFIGVRDNPESASAYTISPARAKLQAFAVSGGIAGLAGGLLGGLLVTISAGEVFTVESSLEIVAIAVIGGVGSVVGPVLGAVWVVGLPALWPDNAIVPLLASSMGLLILLMYFPGGLVQIGYGARDALLQWADKRLPDTVVAPKPTAIPKRTDERPAPVAVPDDGIVLRATDVSVRFGGRIAVDHVSIELGANEVIGLIGTNGAGKSTLMNAIGGYVPSTGQVEILGQDVSHMPPHKRARLGIGRAFQAARLFPDLSVRETIQIALEARHRTSFLATALFLPHGFKQDRRQRADADELMHFLGLGRYADNLIAELSTGTRRIVELAGLLALDARILCLDEPTAGVAQRETEAFGPVILRIREELGATVLVIEHDMPLIMGISDRVYCLEAGRVIAQGPPDQVRHDPKVVASYLGTDERAILRSGEVPSVPDETEVVAAATAEQTTEQGA